MDNLAILLAKLRIVSAQVDSLRASLSTCNEAKPYFQTIERPCTHGEALKGLLDAMGEPYSNLIIEHAKELPAFFMSEGGQALLQMFADEFTQHRSASSPLPATSPQDLETLK